MQPRLVDDGGGQEQMSLFIHHAYVSFQQTPLTQLSVKDKEVAYMIYYVKTLAKQTTVSLYIR